jgi:hypothetical protein
MISMYCNPLCFSRSAFNNPSISGSFFIAGSKNVFKKQNVDPGLHCALDLID